MSVRQGSREDFIMNTFMETQCKNMLTQLDIFNQSMRLAAMKDDGHISHEEEKQLSKLQKASEKFAADIKKVMGA